ncbi:MAG: glucose 1-dehydrogenase [Opitutaceae bacterium]
MSLISQKLSGQVAVVTGASKGIGAAIATHLAGAGAAVVVNYSSSREGADRVVAKIKAAGGKAIAVQADVSKPAEVERLFAEAKSTFGRLDILVNNAGVYEFVPLADVTEAIFHRQFNLNVLGLLLASQKAAAAFDAAGGSIINISSIVSTLTPPASSVYSATKAAVDAITKTLAKELGSRKIRINSLSPGGIETEGTHTAGIIGGDFEKQLVAQTPLGRIGQPDDVARVALFLASADSGWISGEVIVVAGGHPH